MTIEEERAAKIAEVRQRINARLEKDMAERAKRLEESNKMMAPLYDDVYFEGVAMLDELEHEPELPVVVGVLVEKSVCARYEQDMGEE